MKNEAQMGNIAFLGIPSWGPAIIIPITFGLMAFRFGLRSFKNFLIIVKKETTLHWGKER